MSEIKLPFLAMFLQDKVMVVALVSALAIHAVIVFGISFDNPVSANAMMQEIANVFNENEQAHQKADYIAQSSQKGQGSEDNKRLIKSPYNSPVASDTQAPINDIKNTQKKQSAEQYMQSYLRATLSLQKVNSESQNKADNKKNNDAQEEENRIMAQIATLEAQFATRQNTLTKSQGVKTLSSLVDTQASPEAAYMNKFKQRVEQVGNAHFPEVIRNLGLTGDARLKVVIAKNGELEQVKLLQSSGSKLIDRYAMESVRYAAPFGEFSKAMLEKQLSQINIIRTWRFSDGIVVEDDEALL